MLKKAGNFSDKNYSTTNIICLRPIVAALRNAETDYSIYNNFSNF